MGHIFLYAANTQDFPAPGMFSADFALVFGYYNRMPCTGAKHPIRLLVMIPDCGKTPVHPAF